MQFIHGSACVVIMNNASQLFNGRLISVVDQLNSDFMDAKLSLSLSQQ
jgi:hypothetical protein